MRGLAACCVVAALAFTTGCGGGSTDLNGQQVRSLRARFASPSKYEREWVQNWTLVRRAACSTADGSLICRRISKAALVAHAAVLRATVYSTPTAAPALTIAVNHPAKFLSTHLGPVLGSLGSGPAFLYVVDSGDRLVYEFQRAGNGGGSHVRPDLMGCSSLVDNGLGVPPPCPSD